MVAARDSITFDCRTTPSSAGTIDEQMQSTIAVLLHFELQFFGKLLLQPNRLISASLSNLQACALVWGSMPQPR
jgi:hypothetical protein